VVLQAVVELADEFVEQVPLGGGVPVALVSAAPVVVAGTVTVGGGGECLDPELNQISSCVVASLVTN
jgi:hypothetical protein